MLQTAAHRVTLMDKDFIVLRRLRYRFSKLLEPIPIQISRPLIFSIFPPLGELRKRIKLKLKMLLMRGIQGHMRRQRSNQKCMQRERGSLIRGPRRRKK